MALPWIIAAAASELAAMQKRRKAAEELYGAQLRSSAQRQGGNTDMAELMNAAREIGAIRADYSPQMLSLIGREFDSGDDEDVNDYEERRRRGVQPRSGVRMRITEF